MHIHILIPRSVEWVGWKSVHFLMKFGGRGTSSFYPEFPVQNIHSQKSWNSLPCFFWIQKAMYGWEVNAPSFMWFFSPWFPFSTCLLLPIIILFVVSNSKEFKIKVCCRGGHFFWIGAHLEPEEVLIDPSHKFSLWTWSQRLRYEYTEHPYLAYMEKPSSYFPHSHWIWKPRNRSMLASHLPCPLMLFDHAFSPSIDLAWQRKMQMRFYLMSSYTGLSESRNNISPCSTLAYVDIYWMCRGPGLRNTSEAPFSSAGEIKWLTRSLAICVLYMYSCRRVITMFRNSGCAFAEVQVGYFRDKVLLRNTFVS